MHYPQAPVSQSKSQSGQDDERRNDEDGQQEPQLRSERLIHGRVEDVVEHGDHQSCERDRKSASTPSGFEQLGGSLTPGVLARLDVSQELVSPWNEPVGVDSFETHNRVRFRLERAGKLRGPAKGCGKVAESARSVLGLREKTRRSVCQEKGEGEKERTARPLPAVEAEVPALAADFHDG